MKKAKNEKTYKKAIVIGGITGAGKSSVTEAVVKKLNFLERSISVTTRKKRKGEINGKNYYFTSTRKFLELSEKGRIIEYTQVLNNFYGTLRSELEKTWKKGKYPVLNIDYNGIRNLEKSGISLLKIYLVPPTYNELIRRILKRGISKNEFCRRIYFIGKELKTIFDTPIRCVDIYKIQFDKLYTKKYDYIINNDNYERTIEKITEYIGRHKWT